MKKTTNKTITVKKSDVLAFIRAANLEPRSDTITTVCPVANAAKRAFRKAVSVGYDSLLVVESTKAYVGATPSDTAKLSSWTHIFTWSWADRLNNESQAALLKKWVDVKIVVRPTTG